MKQLLTRLAPVWLVLLCQPLYAQTPFWSENFSNGIPTGWTSEDGSGQGVIWRWCNDPASTDPDCPPVFNGQEPFQSSTATTGFAAVNSDKAGPLATSHLARLTTPAINCASKSKVFVRMETFIGVYATSAETGAVLRVSTDKINWTKFTLFPGLSPQVTWSANPAIPIVDISDKAANQPVVYLQWEWTGNYEYTWNVDDIGVYSEDPSLHHDVAISDYYYPPSSFATPASQIATDTFAFGAYLTNKGLDHATNLMLKAEVQTQAGEAIFADSVSIAFLGLGVKDSFFALPGYFVPVLAKGDYRVVYSVRFDSVDQRPVDNRIVAPFKVTNYLFSKESAPQVLTRPGQPGNWAIGNYYRMSAATLEHYKAVRAEFAFGTDPSELSMAEVTAPVYLLRVTDDVADDFSNFDTGDLLSSSLDLAGIANYAASDTLADCQLQTVDLLDLTTGETGVPLQTGGRYFLVILYQDGSSNAYHCFNRDVPARAVSTVVFRSNWFLGGFTGSDDNAVARLYLDLVTTADEKPLAPSTLLVAPNPVEDDLHLHLQFERPTNATITIADLSGRVIQMEDRQGLTEARLTYSLPHLLPGTYLARVATAEGSLTQKFIVLH